MRNLTLLTLLILMGGAVVTTTACSTPDPMAVLQKARAEHEVKLQSWSVSTRETDDGPRHSALVSLLVTDQGSPLELDCLTVEFTYQDADGATLGSHVQQIGIENLASVGGSKDVTLELQIPTPDVDAIGVDKVMASGADLEALCEAKAIAAP